MKTCVVQRFIHQDVWWMCTLNFSCSVCTWKLKHTETKCETSYLGSDVFIIRSLHTDLTSIALTRNDAKTDWFCISDSNEEVTRGHSITSCTEQSSILFETRRIQMHWLCVFRRQTSTWSSNRPFLLSQRCSVWKSGWSIVGACESISDVILWYVFSYTTVALQYLSQQRMMQAERRGQGWLYGLPETTSPPEGQEAVVLVVSLQPQQRLWVHSNSSWQ